MRLLKPFRAQVVPKWIYLSLCQMAQDVRFSSLFVISLTVGLLSFGVITSLKTSLDSYFSDRSRSILGADIRVSATRDLSEEERKIIEDTVSGDSLISKQVLFYTMVSTDTQSKLLQVQAVDQHFPLYEGYELEKQGAVTSKIAYHNLIEDQVWIYPEIKTQLNLNPSSKLFINKVPIRIKDILVTDPSLTTAGFNLAPKIFMSLESMERLNLIKKGSRIFYQYLIKLSPQEDPEFHAKNLIEKFNKTDLRVISHTETNNQLGRVLTYLSDFLGLISLIALCLAGIGIAYLCHLFIERRRKDIAVFMAIGASQSFIKKMYLFHLLTLALGAAIFATLGTLFLIPFLENLIIDFLPHRLVLGLSWEIYFKILVVSLGGCFLFCWPFIKQIDYTKPAQLFMEEDFEKKGSQNFQIKWLLLISIAFWVLGFWQSQSFLITNFFIIFLSSAAVVLGAVGLLLLKTLNKIPKNNSFIRHLVFWSLLRHRASTLIFFIALGTGILLTSYIPQLYEIMTEEIQGASTTNAPDLFMFDIQEEQIEPLQEIILSWAKTDPRLAVSGDKITPQFKLAPLVRARLDKINGITLQSLTENNQTTKEKQLEANYRSRSYNLTYTEKLSPANTIIEGKEFSGIYDWQSGKLPEISLEFRFAQRQRVKVGDQMSFNLEGVEVTGVIKNIRRVKWANFEPNFLVAFQPGVFDDAPKVFVLSVKGGWTLEQKAVLQNLITRNFANVSIIEVSRALERITKVITQVGLVIFFMAILTLVAGLGVFFAIGLSQAGRRKKEFGILKILGSSFRDLQGYVLMEFALIGFISSLTAIVISYIGSFFTAKLVYDSLYLPSINLLLTAIITFSILTTLIGYLTSKKLLKTKPTNLIS